MGLLYRKACSSVAWKSGEGTGVLTSLYSHTDRKDGGTGSANGGNEGQMRGMEPVVVGTCAIMDYFEARCIDKKKKPIIRLLQN